MCVCVVSTAASEDPYPEHSVSVTRFKERKLCILWAGDGGKMSGIRSRVLGIFSESMTECASEKKIIFAGRVVRPEIDQPKN